MQDELSGCPLFLPPVFPYLLHLHRNSAARVVSTASSTYYFCGVENVYMSPPSLRGSLWLAPVDRGPTL